MNFLFDLTASQPNNDGDFHGGGKYTKKLFFELAKLHQSFNWTLLVLIDSSRSIDNEIALKIGEFKFQTCDVNNSTIPDLVRSFNISRFYTALPFSVIKYGLESLFVTKCEIYVTIHGLRTLETQTPLNAIQYVSGFKDKCKLLIQKLLEKRFLARDHSRYKSLLEHTNVIAVSNHTKYSILTYFPSAAKKIEVFYSPDVTEFEEMSSEIPDFHHSNYFLLVSGNRWLKNNLRSVIALDQLFTEKPEITQNVIITGVNNPQLYLKNIKNTERFTFYKYVSESVLRLLYKNAYAFLYMTLNEGFGYPPLDAMKYGIPIITSPFTSIPEVCGDCVLYSNPYSIPEIKNRILQVLDKKTHKILSEKGLERFTLINQIQEKDLSLSINFLLS